MGGYEPRLGDDLTECCLGQPVWIPAHVVAMEGRFVPYRERSCSCLLDEAIFAEEEALRRGI